MEAIQTALKDYLSALNLPDFSPDLTPAPENTGADFSTNLALRLAKPLKKSPLEIATDLKSALAPTLKNCQIDIAAPGFLNFTLTATYWETTLTDLETKSFSANTYQNQTLLTEFSDPNPFKVLHVGHLYTSVVGDAISRLLENAGGNVKRLNFGGDVGLHVAKNLYILKNHETEIANDLSPSESAELLGKCYVEGTRAYEDDETAHKKIDDLNQTIYTINQNGEDYVYDDPETAKIARLYWWGRKISYAYFAEFYQTLGLVFDEFIPESAVAALGKQTVLDHTPETYQESAGAIVFKGEPYGLHTRVFINKAGLPTYEAKDVGLIFKKDQTYHFDKSIVITGDEQREYMRVVMKSIEQYAPDLIEKSVHLTHGMVKLPGAVKMSSRKGNFVRAVDVISHVKSLVQEAHSTPEITTPSEADPNAIISKATDPETDKIALGAIKYAFLKSKLGGDLELDLKETISTTGNSGPYLQYSAVRAQKILAKFSASTASQPQQTESPTGLTNPAEPTSPTKPTELIEPTSPTKPTEPIEPANSTNPTETNPFELALIKKLSGYESVLSEATAELAPHKLATYLYSLAGDFSRFYEHCPVVGSENSAFRAKIVAVYLKIITHGLNLLGIEIPERM